MMSNYHVPVMLRECVEGLNINPKGTYVDVTYGGGGHSQAILNELDEDGTLLENFNINDFIERNKFLH